MAQISNINMAQISNTTMAQISNIIMVKISNMNMAQLSNMIIIPKSRAWWWFMITIMMLTQNSTSGKEDEDGLIPKSRFWWWCMIMTMMKNNFIFLQEKRMRMVTQVKSWSFMALQDRHQGRTVLSEETLIHRFSSSIIVRYFTIHIKIVTIMYINVILLHFSPFQNGERFSRKVFVGGLPPDIDEGQQSIWQENHIFEAQSIQTCPWLDQTIHFLSCRWDHSFIPPFWTPGCGLAT